MFETLNWLDLAFASIAIIFVITAFFRGFVREVFSLFNWIVAIILSHLIAPYASELAIIYSKNKLVADIVSRSMIFIAAFIIFAISTSKLCKTLKEKMPQYFDKSLGVLWGLLKTLLVFGVAYSILINAFASLSERKIDENSEQFPIWLKEAKCFSILKFSGEIVDPSVKLFFDEMVKNFDQVIPNPKSELDQKINEVIGKKKTELNENNNESNLDIKDSGYNKKDIEKMNHLIEIIDK
jgi:membrane protein required for colicin V production